MTIRDFCAVKEGERTCSNSNELFETVCGVKLMTLIIGWIHVSSLLKKKTCSVFSAVLIAPFQVAVLEFPLYAELNAAKIPSLET